MKNVYVVRTVPVIGADRETLGWVRVDLLADGTKPTDTVILRDGSAYGQAEAAERIALDPGLLYPTREEAVRDGLERLRSAHARGETRRVRRRRSR